MPVAMELVTFSVFYLHSAHRSESHLKVLMIAATVHYLELVEVTVVGGWLLSKIMEMSLKAGMRVL
jgi:hypothetical protein